jgi:hypothetical protein
LINLGGFSFFGRKLTILPMVFFIFLILTPLIATLPEPVSAITFAPTQNLSNSQGDSINPQVAVSGLNVYVAWEENNNLLFRRSTNDGINFDSITILSNTGGVYSPNIVKSGSNVYVVWDDVNGIFFRRSTDDGASWKTPLRLSNEGFSPKIAASGNNVYVVWNREIFEEEGDVQFRRSVNSGASFSNTRTLTGSESYGHTHIAASGNNVYVVWDDFDSGNEIHLRKSANRGNSFSNIVSINQNNAVADNPRIVVSGTNLYVIWTQDTSGNDDVWFRRSTNNGGNWGNPINLSNNPTQSIAPQITTTGSHVYVVWQDGISGTGKIFFRGSHNNGNNWIGPTDLTLNIQGDSSDPQISRIGTNVRVVWQTEDMSGNDDIWFRDSTNNGGTWENSINLSNNPGESQRQKIISSGSGNTYVVWQDNTNTPGANFDIFFRPTGITLPPTGDADGDSLLNGWEQMGIDANSDGIIDLNLPMFGANPLHKDKFVEIDFMEFHRPIDQAISNVITAFDNAPISNPDGTLGIDLHLQVDEQVPHQDSIQWRSGFDAIKNTNFGTATQRTDPNAANILSAKMQAYHYSIFIHTYGNSGSSGIAELPGNDFVVSLGAPGWAVDPITGHTTGNLFQQDGTLMHELGHNLNLGHGGGDGHNYKPNYLSVMSYAFQFPSTVANRPLDYSRSALATLNENGLNEPDGISPSTPSGLRTYICSSGSITDTGIPVDWNIDGDTVDTGVIRSINCDGLLVTLNGYNDWINLQYSVAGMPGLAVPAGVEEPTGPADITIDEVRRQRLSLLEDINRSIQNLSNTAFDEPANALGIKNNLSSEVRPDNGSIAVLLESDDLEQAIQDLTGLRSTMDSSFRGSATNDVITSPAAQSEIVSKIDNLIAVLEKQK